MSRLLTAAALALSLTAGLTGAASAQSYNAPAGIPTATAPGGLDGTHHGQRLQQSGAAATDTVFTTGSIRRARSAR